VDDINVLLTDGGPTVGDERPDWEFDSWGERSELMSIIGSVKNLKTDEIELATNEALKTQKEATKGKETKLKSCRKSPHQRVHSSPGHSLSRLWNRVVTSSFLVKGGDRLNLDRLRKNK
jgi:hypothetical protein